MQLIRGGGERINKALGGAEYILAGIREKNLNKKWSKCRHGRTAGERFGDWRGSSRGNKNTLECNNQPYGEWCAQTDKEKNNNKVKLTVTYDMGWQKISYGMRYDSSSGHAFIIRERTKGIIGMVLYSKVCRKCDDAEKAEKKQKNMSAQRTSREARKVWSLLKFWRW